jgi:hypothetical protein
MAATNKAILPEGSFIAEDRKRAQVQRGGMVDNTEIEKMGGNGSSS